MVKHLSLCLLLASTAALSLTSGGQAPKDGEARKKEVTTVQYGVKDLVGSNVIWRGRAGEKERQVDGSDDIIRLIVEHVNPKEWRGDQSSILEVNGTALEIRTTKANHAEIADLFAALRRSADVQVVAESGLYAVDRAFYEKEFAPQFIKNRSRPLALDLKEQDQLLKASRTEKLNKVKLSNGGRGQVFSLRRAVAYEWLPPLGASKKAEVALVGVSLELEGRVSGDRRFVRMTLTQRGAELLETRKEVTSNAEGEEVVLSVPDVQQSSTTNSITVGDGGFVVIPPSVPLPGFTAKGPVPLLFVRPTIWIGEEEAELKRREEKK